MTTTETTARARANPPPIAVVAAQPQTGGDAVINFAERTAIRPQPIKDRRIHPDRKLIEACVDYAAFIVGAEGAFAVDPTDSIFATVTDDIARARGGRELATATRTRPTTMDGLRAKSAVGRIILGKPDDLSLNLEEPERRFLLSLMTDVARFHLAAHIEGRSNHAKIKEERR